MAKSKGRVRQIILIVAVAAIVVGIFSYYLWNRHYKKLLDVGSQIDSFMATYSKDVKSMTPSLILSSYADNARVDFLSRTDAPQAIDGAQKIAYLAGPTDRRPPLAEQLKNYFDPIARIDNAKFKLNRVYDFSDHAADIRMRFQVWGQLKTGEGFYDSGLLAATLDTDKEGAWQIESQELEKAWRITKPSTTYFTDVTAESGLNPKLGSLQEVDDLYKDHKFSVHSRLGRGMAVADVNGDGYPDVLLSGNQRAALYINDGKGHFTDAALDWGLGPDETRLSIIPLLVDFDNDGKVDLLLLRQFEKSKLFRNEGNRFKDVTASCGLDIDSEAMTACAADYDNDGNIDLFIGSYGNTRDDVPETVVRSRNGRPSHLYRNLGNWTFEDVTKRAGINETGWALASTFYDLDGDGKPDIYVGNDFGYNCFYRNNGDGTFTDNTWQAGTHDIGSTMNISLLDYDGDGKLDIYTSGIAANTIWFQGPGMNYILGRFLTTPATFKQTFATFVDLGTHVSISEINQLGYKVNDGDSLMRNTGGGKYEHVEQQTGSAWAEWAWGAADGDFDCDGNTDIYVANGFITAPDTKDF